MIAPEYFNNHVAVEGEIIVKSVPNDAGFVLVWNPTTKKISRRTHAEIAVDLGYWQRYNDPTWNSIRSDKAFAILDSSASEAQNIYSGGILVSNDYSDQSKIPTNGIYSKGNIATLNYGSAVDWALAYNWTQTQGATMNWVTGNFVTLNTPQNITARKSFSGSTSDTYEGAAIEILGNGSTILPSLSFHQPGVFAGVMSYRGDDYGYYFMSANADAFRWLNALGYRKSGSNDDFVLTGGGGHKPVSDFALATDLNNFFSNSKIQSREIGVVTTTLDSELPNGGFITSYYTDSWGGSDRPNGASYGGYIKFSKGGVDDNNLDFYYNNGHDGTDSRLWFRTKEAINSTRSWVETYHTGNFNPDSKVNKSGDTMTGGLTITTPDSVGSNNLGVLPTNYKLFLSNVSQYGTVFWTEGSGQGYIQQQRADGTPHSYRLNLQPYGGELYYGNSEVATTADLNDFVTINTPQTIIANKNFAPTAILTLNGIDLNSTTSFNETTGDIGIVSGWVHRHYNNFWKVGHKRGGSDNSLGYAFQFSSNDGATYDEKVLFTPDGNILTSAFGAASDWNSKVSQSQLANYWSKSELPDYRNYGLGRSNEGATNFNLNNIAETSILGINDTTTSRPSGLDYGSVWTHRKNSGEFTQLAVDVITGHFFTRGWSNGSGDTGWRKHWDNVNLPNPVDQGQLANYLPLSGGTLTGGGRIGSNGDIILQQSDTGGNATGLFWESIDNTQNISGIGTLTTDGGFEYMYMGWGGYPWDPATGFNVSDNFIRYKGNDIWHSGNLPQANVDYLAYLLSVGAATIGYVNTNFQPIGQYVRVGGTGTFGNEISFGWTGTQLQATVDVTTIGNLWHTGNFNPNTKANGQENAKAIGFSSGSLPTSNGVEYPYMYYDNGLTTAYIALATQDFVSTNFHKINPSGSLTNASDSNTNRSFFDYNWAGTGYAGSVINFSGLNGNYSTELFSDYTSNTKIGIRTHNGDAVNAWTSPRWLWHDGNFNPASYVTQSSLNTQLANYATLDGVQTFSNTNTFQQSPVIPDATIGVHAVNLNQLLDVAPPYYWNYVGQSAIVNRRVLREMTWNNYGNNHTIFDISSSTTPWGASKSNVDAEQPWSPSYPTLVGGNGSGTYGVRVDSARNADNLGGIPAGNYATQTWVNTNFIPKSHPVYNITQANINSWNAAAGGSSHTHSNLFYLDNIDQYLGTGQAPQFGSIKLMNSLGYGLLALEEGFIGGEIGLVDISNKRFYAGRINEYLKYGSSIDGFEGLNIHFDAQLLGIGKEIGNGEDKVQLAGDLSVDTVDINNSSRQLILNPLYNTDGDVRGSRNAHIYIVTGNSVRLPSKPILGQRIEIFNESDSNIEVIHDNVGLLFYVPGFYKLTGIVGARGFIFDEKPLPAKKYDV